MMNLKINTKPNKLIEQKSPYLLQHAYNPVNWYAWGPEAFDKAKKENKPIFLSIGYSTCHWCHVMAHESFENEIIAEYLNNHFVSIKLDREERPEIDNIYMNICQAVNGTGGWPLSVFMDFNQKPFFVNTYFPPEDRHGRIGFLSLIKRINDIWIDDFEKIEVSINALSNSLTDLSTNDNQLYFDDELVEKTYDDFLNNFDSKKGGFNKFPKFPSPHNLLFLFNYAKTNNNSDALLMAEKTLFEMSLGGIFDHVGKGFHRYSTDENWLVPHFEKMLYDQAMLLMAYTEAFKTTKNEYYKIVAYDIIDYLKNDMLSPLGGFYSAEDADSEGVEGKFYVWSYDEIKEILPAELFLDFIAYYNISKEGNFLDESKHIKTGYNIPHITTYNFELSKKLKPAIELLYQKRKNRIHPLKDTKILADWNGLIIASISKASRVFNDASLSNIAINAYRFVKNYLTNQNGELIHRYIDDEAGLDATAEDYSFIIWGLIELYELTLDDCYLIDAIKFNETFIKYYWDEINYGFYFSPSHGEKLIHRSKQTFDNAIPASNSIAIFNLIKIYNLTADTKYGEYLNKLLSFYGKEVVSYSRSFAMAINGYLTFSSTNSEIIIFENNDKLNALKYVNALQKKDNFNYTLLYVTQENYSRLLAIAPFLSSFGNEKDSATVYICTNHVCNLPLNNLNDFMKQLELI